MKFPNQAWRAILAGAAWVMALTRPANADEGMWLYTAPPLNLLEQHHHFTPTPAWLDHLEKSSVKFGGGASASFVSEDGLLLSNHHVGAGSLHRLSDATHDFLRDGFHARTRAEERRCPGVEVNALVAIEDVTKQVQAAVRPGLSPDEAAAARRAVMAGIEKESLERTGLKSEVVTLYEGGLYHLYRYKRYDDVRLVWAPELKIAAFGGDPDNFEYPRFDLDVCLFRVYENGHPAKIQNHLHWSPTGVADGDLVFVSGHPGRTFRSLTVDELANLRDVQFPARLERLYRREVVIGTWSKRSQENARRAKALLRGVENGRKALTGMLAGLLDPAIFARKTTAEAALKTAISNRTDLRPTLSAWTEIARARQSLQQVQRDYDLLEGATGFDSQLFGIARTLVRAAEESSKPNGTRLREFRDSNRASLELGLFSPEPIYADFEKVRLADSLTWLVEQRGHADPLVQRVLAGASPQARAAALVDGTRLMDVDVRRKLYAGGDSAVRAANDPLIELARLIDPEARRLRTLVEAQNEIREQAYARIAAARFALHGLAEPPDATGTLRLAFGVVRGYREAGQNIPFETTFRGLYQRAEEHGAVEPFDLPPRWATNQARLNLTTTMNFVCTADIIGGNSGSPVVNRNGELVGLIFDGNLQSLVLDTIYTDEQARAVSVNAGAIVEALRKLYDAPDLAEELVTGKAR